MQWLVEMLPEHVKQLAKLEMRLAATPNSATVRQMHKKMTECVNETRAEVAKRAQREASALQHRELPRY